MKFSQDTTYWLNQRQKPFYSTLDKHNLLAMDLGECVLGKQQENLSQIDFSQLNRYPNQYALLKEAIAQAYDLLPSMITLGNGSDEIIEHIPQISIDPGDNVLIVVPTFFRFIDTCIRKQANIHFIETKQEDTFCVTEETVNRILQVAHEKNVRLLWLCSPNNPTGIPIKTEFIEQIINQTHALVVVDQVYAELQNSLATEIISLAKTHDNVIILKSFSKVFGLAGIRVGFAIAQPQIIAALDGWNLSFNISSLSLKIAHETVKNKEMSMQIKNAVRQERDFLFTEIARLENIELINKSETNIFLLRHKEKNLFQELLQKDILAADMRNAKGLEGLGFTRVTVGNHKDNRTFLQALQDIN